MMAVDKGFDDAQDDNSAKSFDTADRRMGMEVPGETVMQKNELQNSI